MIADDELERLEDDYVNAAALALEAGFQAVDIKAVHGYLISELLGAKTRERTLWRSARKPADVLYAI